MPDAMPVYHDQLNRGIELAAKPKRIISLVPSQTELLFELGLDTEIVGVTGFCLYPIRKTSPVAKIGGTKQLNMQMIHQLRPDLIIANKEENERLQVEELMARYPVWVSDINNLPTALDMINRVGGLVGKQAQSAKLSENITRQFDSLVPLAHQLRVAYLIWRKPYMAAGGGTFIDAMLQLCGFTNAVTKNRYPEISPDDLVTASPGIVLLSSEPYPFGQKHVNEFQQLLPDAKIILVDGEMFSWYGSRLLHAPRYFNRLINSLR